MKLIVRIRLGDEQNIGCLQTRKIVILELPHRNNEHVHSLAGITAVTNLSLGPVLVQASHAGKVLGWNRWRVLLADKGVRVGRVSDHEHLWNNVHEAAYYSKLSTPMVMLVHLKN